MATRSSALLRLVGAVLFTLVGCGGDAGVAMVRSESIGQPETTGSDPTDPDGTDPDTTGPDTTGPDTTTDESPGTDPAEDSFGWTEFGDGLEQGTFDVPIDYANPDAGSFTLYIIRRLASDPSERIGTLLVNPGGPGVGGTYLAEFAGAIYGQDILDSFDILGWDPRGTGQTVPAVDCVDEYDPYVAIDASPDTPREQQDILTAAESFGEACASRSGEILPFVSTRDTATDMDTIRQALGEETISYFGFSYGSELGITWASLFPATVRALVIDGAVDLSVGYLQQNLEQAGGFEGTFETFLADCSARTECSFYNGGDAEGAFDALNAAADNSPVAGPPGRPAITQGVLTTAVVDSMYIQDYWPTLEVALDDLQSGDGEGVLALYDDYYAREPDGSYDNSLEAYFAINCLDDPGTKDPQVLFDMQDEFAAAAPRLGASWILELQFCAAWPVPAAKPVPFDAAGAGPVVIVGTTGDPATPLLSTRKMADALQDGRLVVVTADQHTGYGLNDCVNEAVDHYLVTLEPPADELICE